MSGPFLDARDLRDTILGHTELEVYRRKRDITRIAYRLVCHYGGGECFSGKVEVLYEGLYRLLVLVWGSRKFSLRNDT